MCGIAGWFHYRDLGWRADAERARRMADRLWHRGPDAGGVLLDRSTGLIHRRLSILDLRSEGDQPMVDPESGWAIVYNGEVYNHGDLRRELEGVGRSFRTRTDTEVVLKAFQQWGVDCLNRLDGMFALAIWSPRDRQLWLARDGLGIKPLYYQDRGGLFSFASEAGALLIVDSLPPQPDLEAITETLVLGYPAAPRSGFLGIQQLRPGSWISITPEKQEVRGWYQLPYPDEPPRTTRQEACIRLENALQRSVRDQLVADVPVGAFLSGGLDSTAIVRAVSTAGKTMSTHCIGMQEESFGEQQEAMRVADRYGTKHQTHWLESPHWQAWELASASSDTPLLDNSLLPFWELCAGARPDGKVFLSGDGADELLGGYETYDATRMAAWWRRTPGRRFRALPGRWLKQLPGGNQKYSLALKLERFLEGASEDWPLDHASWRMLISPDALATISTPKTKQLLAATDPRQRYAESLHNAPPWLDRLGLALHLDLSFHLPNDMLLKVDRASMDHGLEVRVPFLGRDVVEASLAIPSAAKRSWGIGKKPLRDLLAKDFPRSWVDRKKSGFLIPVSAWLRGPWKEALADRVDEGFCLSTGLLEWRQLQRWQEEHRRGIIDHGYRLFALLSLAQWWNRWFQSDAWQVRRTSAAQSDLRWQHLNTP
ncbi:MAG: asparagine synthase (glutamine-hydrolyzing) [Pirellulaceae bacterium]